MSFSCLQPHKKKIPNSFSLYTSRPQEKPLSQKRGKIRLPSLHKVLRNMIRFGHDNRKPTSALFKTLSLTHPEQSLEADGSETFRHRGLRVRGAPLSPHGLCCSIRVIGGNPGSPTGGLMASPKGE